MSDFGIITTQALIVIISIIIGYGLGRGPYKDREK